MKKLFIASFCGLLSVMTSVTFGSDMTDGVDALYEKGIALRNAANLSEAKECFQKVVTLSGHKHANAMHNVGVILYKEKDYKGAAAQFKAAAELKSMPSQRTLWRMIIAKEIESKIEERFLAICDLNGYLLPLETESLSFNFQTESFKNAGSMSLPSIYSEELFDNTGTITADIIWVENEMGLINLGTVKTKLMIVGTKKVI